MKKVIILCSALVFGFLTSSEAYAEIDVNSVTYVNAKNAVEEIFTELLNVAGEGALQKRHQEFSVLVGVDRAKGWKIGWRGTKDISIEKNKQGDFVVKFKDPRSQVSDFGVDRIKNFLKSVQAEIDQYKATRKNKQQVLNELQSRGNNRVSSRRNFAGNLSDRRGFVQNRVQQFEQNSSENNLNFNEVEDYYSEGLSSNSLTRNSRVPSRRGSISSLSSSSTPYSSAESLDSESSKSRGSLSGRSSVKDLARRFENVADEYVEDYYSEGLSSNGSTRNSRVPSRRNSTINGVPVVDGGRYATDKGGSANNSRRNSVHDLIQQFEQNSTGSSPRNSVNNLSSGSSSVKDFARKFESGKSYQDSLDSDGEYVEDYYSEGLPNTKDVIPYDSEVIISDPGKYVEDKLKNLRDLMNEGKKIPKNSTAYLSQDDINKIEDLLDTELAKKVYSKNELDSYIKEAIVNYLRSKAPAVALPPEDINKLNSSNQQDQIKAKQLIENMLTSAYKCFLGYDPKRKYETWQSSGAEGEIKEIVRLLGERLRRSTGKPIGSTNVIINKGLWRTSVKFESKDAEKWVGSANAIKLLYRIIHEKETELRMTYIMQELIEYEKKPDNANASNDSLSTSDYDDYSM